MHRSFRDPLALTVVMVLAPMAAAEPTSLNRDEVKAVVAEMLADAEGRSSLLAAGDAGHDGRFFLAGDGYRLNVGGTLQFRYLADFRDDANADDFESGFQTRYTQLRFGGTLDTDWLFSITAAFDRDGGGLELEDAYAGYTFENGWMLLGGQLKAPLLRETLITNYHQLAVESSLAEVFFGGGRTQGVAVAKQADDWSFVFGFSDGAHADNTDFTAFNGVSEADYSFTPRFQYKFDGDWKQFEDFTSPRGSAFAAMVGGALHYQQSRNTPNPADTDIELLRYTVDLSLEGDGWNAFGAFYGSYADVRAAGANSTLADFGAVIQGGVMVAEKTEVFARWDAIFADSDRGFSESDMHFITLGVNQYLAGHAAKLTIDGVLSLNDTSGLVGAGVLPDTAVGLLGDAEENEFLLRAQFQVLF